MASDYFLRLDLIPGESTDEDHLTEIVLDSVSWGLAAGPDDGGERAVRPREWTYTAPLTKASPRLLLACATGEPIATGRLAYRLPGSPPFEVLQVSFEDGDVRSYEVLGQAQGPTRPTDSFTIAWGKVTFDYRQQTADGGGVEDVVASFDFRTSTAG